MRLAERPHDLKLTVPRCGSCHREVHAYRNWRGLVVSHRHVDVTTIVEIATAQGLFPLAHVIRDADIRDVVDLTTELRRVKIDPSASGSGWWLARAAPVAARIPGLFPAMYALMGHSPRVRQHTGMHGLREGAVVVLDGRFGRDLASAHPIDAALRRILDEHLALRVDLPA